MRRAAALLLALGCGGANPARDQIGAPPAAHGAGWTCPMHPEVHRAAAGTCPTCGMPLVDTQPGSPR